MPRMFAPVILCALLSGPALAVEPGELLDADLERRDVELVSLAQGRLSFFDADRRLTQADAGDFVSLTLLNRPAAEPGDGAPHRLVLADGHELPGRFAGADESDRVLWETQYLGELAIELDSIGRLDLSAPAEGAGEGAPAGGPPAAADDRITLRNGDVASGFVEGLTAEGPSILVAGESVALPWDRIARIHLANPPRHRPGAWVRLADGTRARFEGVRLDAEQFSGEALGPGEVELPASAVLGVEFAQRHRLVGLGDLERRVVSGGVVFGVPMPPVFRRGGVVLHAPVAVRFDLPEGARRFAADATIDPDGLDWADLYLIVSDGDGEVFKQRLNADQPHIRVNVPLAGRSLTIELDEGANGPIRDQLVLTSAVILVEH